MILNLFNHITRKCKKFKRHILNISCDFSIHIFKTFNGHILKKYTKFLNIIGELSKQLIAHDIKAKHLLQHLRKYSRRR